MKALIRLAAQSAWNRRFVLSLVVLSIALSTLLLLGIARLRDDVRKNFAQSVSGTDLIVGARTGSVQLLLYSVFRIGGATNNIQWSSVQSLARLPGVEWVVPISLGDSHRGFPVVATTGDYFRRFRYGEAQPLALAEGRAFDEAPVNESSSQNGPPGLPTDLFGVVLGADVAASLDYRIGDKVVLSHGDGALAANDHADKPFRVIGVLKRTGTPVDRSLHISLAAMEAIHLDWVAGAPIPGQAVSLDASSGQDLTPHQVTAALVGLKRRTAVFSTQRRINDFAAEPLMAILPGVALDELWDVVALGERSLTLMSALVAAVSLCGLVAVILAGLNERRRELAILRAVGANPARLFSLLAVEGMLVTVCGVVLGAALCLLLIAGLGPWVQLRFGIGLSAGLPSAAEWQLLGVVTALGWAASLLPGLRAYALSLSDGLSPKV
ncbi:ABC transporter permease [Mitsuaria sp. 7]|uniref:ABC transporter permease n=1 Tax=Mitsuaria sp. 7 TaxID=1658665 RepID=UPI0007DDA286|nr:ABC transporter permease [Mitsuaria sp. 7]ANH68355.1 peptide ABC transporter permease [Mitsuaria sp. 7]